MGRIIHSTLNPQLSTNLLPLPNLRRTLEIMPAGFDAACRVRLKAFYAASRVATCPSKPRRSWKLYAAKGKQLVADFRANEKFYLSPAYQEQEARRDFIDKFWLALGWDVNHETQKNLDGETRKSQWPNFQNGNALGRMRSRINDRCLFKNEAFPSHGCHSVERQQRHRIEVGIHSPCAWNQRMAAAPAVARHTRFCFSGTARRGICRWLLLARLPVALPDASRQSAILARKNFTKRRERSRNNPPLAPDWLASGSALAALFEGFGLSCGSHQIRIEHNRLLMQR